MPNVSFHIFVTPLYMKTTDKNNADTSRQIEKSIKKKKPQSFITMIHLTEGLSLVHFYRSNANLCLNFTSFSADNPFSVPGSNPG